MNFEIPKIPEIQPKPDSYLIELITPMFGGGVESGKIDSKNPIRISSIRGHLRFWWRMLYGGQYRNSQELFKNEKEIWGSVDNKSPVRLQVAIDEMGNIQPCQNPNNKKGTPAFKKEYPAYALFPFQAQKKEDKSAAECIEKLRFNLKVFYDPDLSEEQKEQVRTTLEFWVNIGGIGARTRRGCGSLYCSELAFKHLDECEAFLQKYFAFDQEDFQLDKKHVLKPFPDSMKAWKKVIKCMQQFRQDSPPARVKKYGRSYWPEPELIRRLYKEQNPGFKLNKNQDSAFETGNEAYQWEKYEKSILRAVFGLPIQFKFQKDKPPLTLLSPKKHDRMASPLILKPIQFKDKRNFALILYLYEPKLNEVKLVCEDKDLLADEKDIQKILNNSTL